MSTPKSKEGRPDPMSDDAGSAKSEKPTIPMPRGPGDRHARIERAAEQILARVREEFGGTLGEEEILAEAQRQFDELVKQDRGVEKQYEKLAPTSVSPRRDKFFDKIEAAAIRRVPQAQEMASHLRGEKRPVGRGRPSGKHLPIAVFERNIYETGRPQVRSNVADFLGCDRLLDWAYDEPVSGSDCGVAPRTVTETMKAALDREDPELTVQLNLEAFQKDLVLRHPNAGRYVAIDGTHNQIKAEQTKAYSDKHEQMLNRDMTGAGFGSHGKHFWRGYTLLVLTDIATTLPLAWIQIPANGDEAASVPALLNLLYKHWPDCPIEYLVGDRGFDVPVELHRTLEERYGIHLVTPWKRSGNDGKSGDLGTPYCFCADVEEKKADESESEASGDGGEDEDKDRNDGAPEDAEEPSGRPMKLVQSDNFLDAAKRRELGIPSGERICFKERKVRHRWKCKHCGNTENTWFWRDPRRHSYLPREGDHWRTDLRTALLIRRNAAESIFALVKHRGIAGRGSEVPRWVSTDKQMMWLAGGCLLALTLRRIAHETGLHDQAYDEAISRELVKLQAGGGMGRANLAPHVRGHAVELGLAA